MDDIFDIHAAIRAGASIELLTQALSKFPDCGACRNRDGLLPLHTALGSRSAVSVIRLLLQSFPDAVLERVRAAYFDGPCSDTWTALHAAIALNLDEDIVTALLEIPASREVIRVCTSAELLLPLTTAVSRRRRWMSSRPPHAVAASPTRQSVRERSLAMPPAAPGPRPHYCCR